jgi:hypothetical protein
VRCEKARPTMAPFSTFLGVAADLLAFSLCKVPDLPKFSG